MADLYELIIKDKAGSALASLTGARQRFFANYLNKPGEARFTISASDPLVTDGMLLLGYNELYIYRAGTLVWGGELAYSRFDLSDGVLHKPDVNPNGCNQYGRMTTRGIAMAEAWVTYADLAD